MKKFQNKYGYFTEDGKEYVITDPFTPKPWINVLSNSHYGIVVSQLNGGFSWLDNSNLNRLTRWNQDLIMDNWGKYIYLRDKENGRFWSPTIQPVKNELDFYECRHGIGYTIFNSRLYDIGSKLRLFVPFDDNLEIWSLTLCNDSQTAKTIEIFTYFEWCLGAAPDSHREFHKAFIETAYDADNNILTAGKRLWEMPSDRGHWNRDWQYKAYFSCSQTFDSYSGNKESFLGRYGTLSEPLALKTGELDNEVGKWHDATASTKNTINLESGQSQTIHFFLGAEQDNEEIVPLIQKYRREENVTASFNKMQAHWRDYLENTTVETPDEALNMMCNHWLKYQAISGRIWARAAYYQQSGAYGFRDQLQDSQIFFYSRPQLAKNQIRLHARHQLKSGAVLHWWHSISDQGMETNMTDDLLWLPFLLIQYLKETADWNFLNDSEPYYDSGEKDTLINHCKRAINLVFNRFTDRGLPQILAGDWNDGLSAVGLDGKGESIWLGHFLYYILNEMIVILNRNGDEASAKKYDQRAEDLKKAINEFGWDGDWFWRASKDNGECIGSKNNKEGYIYLNAQTWSVIACSTTKERQSKAMQAVEKHLEKNFGPLLLYPAYSNPDPFIGYLSRYAPGVRENGGVYTHAATWAIWAASMIDNPDMAYRIFRKICPVINASNADQYAAEPYVTPGNIEGPDSRHYGRGGWTWYTGSASWLFRVTIDHLIGIQASYDGLKVRPCFPAHWPQVKLNRLFRGTMYYITIENIEKESGSKLAITVDGKKIEGDVIPPVSDKKEIHVLIKRFI